MKKFYLQCKNCKSLFYSNSSTAKYCNNCLKEAICSDCQKHLGYKILKNDENKYYCRKCSYKHRCFKLQCSRCDSIFISNASNTKFCDKCLNELNFIAKHTCSCCKKYDENLTRDQNGRGYECGCHQKWNSQHWKKINQSEKQRQRNIAKIIKYIHSEEGQKHLKQHNKELRQQFKIIDSVLYVKDGNNWVEWDQFKKSYIESHTNINLPNDFITIPTFRNQNSVSWVNSKAKFEQYLLDLNICWFIYIKFAIKNNNIIPLVIGKTGSKNVNIYGSDVDFGDYDKNNVYNATKARKFLYEEGMQWLKTHIAILPCENEKDALEKEQYYAKKLNLLQS